MVRQCILLRDEECGDKYNCVIREQRRMKLSLQKWCHVEMRWQKRNDENLIMTKKGNVRKILVSRKMWFQPNAVSLIRVHVKERCKLILSTGLCCSFTLI